MHLLVEQVFIVDLQVDQQVLELGANLTLSTYDLTVALFLPGRLVSLLHFDLLN